MDSPVRKRASSAILRKADKIIVITDAVVAEDDTRQKLLHHDGV